MRTKKKSTKDRALLVRFDSKTVERLDAVVRSASMETTRAAVVRTLVLRGLDEVEKGGLP